MDGRKNEPLKAYILGLLVSVCASFVTWVVMLLPVSILKGSSGFVEAAHNGAVLLSAGSLIISFLVGYVTTVFIYQEMVKKETSEEAGVFKILLSIILTIVIFWIYGQVSLEATSRYETPIQMSEGEMQEEINHMKSEIDFYERKLSNEDALNWVVITWGEYMAQPGFEIQDDGNEGFKFVIENQPTLRNPSDRISPNEHAYIEFVNNEGEELAKNFSSLQLGISENGGNIVTVLNDDVLGRTFELSKESLIELNNGGDNR